MGRVQRKEKVMRGYMVKAHTYVYKNSIRKPTKDCFNRRQ
jgi:hypothetical protein